MKIDETYSIPCPECGGTDFELPEPLEDTSFVKCATCGFEAMLSDIQDHGVHKATEHVTQQIQKQIKDQFGKLFK